MDQKIGCAMVVWMVMDIVGEQIFFCQWVNDQGKGEFVGLKVWVVGWVVLYCKKGKL